MEGCCCLRPKHPLHFPLAETTATTTTNTNTTHSSCWGTSLQCKSRDIFAKHSAPQTAHVLPLLPPE